MDERSTALLEVVRALPARTVAATMRNPNSSADRVFRGPTLHDYALAAGLIPADPRGEIASSYFLVVAEDGARSAVAFAEVLRDAADKDVLLAYEQDGEPVRNGVRLVVTGDYLGGRSIGGVVSVQAKRVQAPATAPGTGRALELAGLLDRPGPVDLERFGPDARTEVDTAGMLGHGGVPVEPHRYGGVRLYALLEAAGIRLDPDQHEDFLGKVVVASSPDGYAVVIAGGEIEPRFMAGDAIVATTCDGAPLRDGAGVRLVVPFDRRPGRSARGVTRIELLQA